MKEYLDVLKKYATFSGRARRREYWMYTLVNSLIFIALWGVGMVLDFIVFVAWIYMLAVLVPGIAVTVRRLHDTGRSGWWFLMNLVPFVGGIVVLIFMCLDSAPGDNAYGANPKGVGMPAPVANPAPAQAPTAPAPAPEVAPAPAEAPAPVAQAGTTPPPPPSV
jgi:uncharacterized membrane protein YhaH (DUF805 family)